MNVKWLDTYTRQTRIAQDVVKIEDRGDAIYMSTVEIEDRYMLPVSTDMFCFGRDLHDAKTRTVLVHELRGGDIVPSDDGYVHSVKTIRVAQDTRKIQVEFWKGPHHTYTREYNASDSITIKVNT